MDGTSSLPILSPFDGREVGRVQLLPPAGVEAAVSAAAAAFPATRAFPTHRRAAILRGIAQRIEAEKEPLAQILSAEAGKPIRAARAEVDRGAQTFLAAASEVDRRTGDLLPLDLNAASEGRLGLVRRFPLGPVLGISPFNFPMNLPAHKVAPAIAVGAPIVVKPAPQTPLSMLELRRIAVESGWPAEAIPVLCVDNAAAEALVLDPRLPVVSFTGSVDVGWRIRSLVPRKKVALELGGNAAVIVHEDADLADAVSRSVAGAFGYAGQVCISLQRALVHRPVYDRYREALVAKAQALVSGDPSSETTDVGPMISEAAALRAEAWVREAVAGGARLLCGGGRRGPFLEPTVLEGTKREMKVECLEVFAPVVTLAPYDSFEEALARAGDSRYGLQAGLFTRDLGRVMKAWESLEVGGVIVNDVPTWRVDRMPYGGVRDSGVGREGPSYAMDEYTEPRLLVLRVP